MNLESIMRAVIEERNRTINNAVAAINATNAAAARCQAVGSQMQEQVVRPMERGGIIPVKEKD